jgi:hypothetical protein
MKFRVAIALALAALALLGLADSAAARRVCRVDSVSSATFRDGIRPVCGPYLSIDMGRAEQGECSGRVRVVVRVRSRVAVRRIVVRLDGSVVLVRRGSRLTHAGVKIDCSSLAPGEHMVDATAHTATARLTASDLLFVGTIAGASSHRCRVRRPVCRTWALITGVPDSCEQESFTPRIKLHRGLGSKGRFAAYLDGVELDASPALRGIAIDCNSLAPGSHRLEVRFVSGRPGASSVMAAERFEVAR